MRCGSHERSLGRLSYDVAAKASVIVFLVIASWISTRAQGAGTWPPAGPFNGMQIKYSIAGATVISTEDGGPFCCQVRTVKGDLPASGTLRVSGSVGMVSGLYADVTVRVTAGNESKEWKAVVDSQKNQWADFDVSVKIPPGATSGSVSISMSGTYGSAAAGESRGVSISGLFAGKGVPLPPPPVATPKPTPRPVTPKPSPTPQNNLDETANAIDDFIDTFKDSCFGQTSGFSLGDKNKFRTSVKSDLQVEDNTPAAKEFLGNRKNAKASTFPYADNKFGPSRTIMALPFKIPGSSQNKTADITNRESLWHETVHHIEIIHGDRNSENNWHAAFRERNGAYLDAVFLKLQALANIESRLGKRDEESVEEWNDRKQALMQGLDGMTEEFKQAEAGVETTKVGLDFIYLTRGEDGPELRSDPKKQWPPDLKELKAWTGIKISWTDILNHYASGACGDDLKAFAQRQLANTAGPQLQYSIDESRPDSGAVAVPALVPAPSPASNASPTPSDQEEHVLFLTSNEYGVQNRGIYPIFKLQTTSSITNIVTYHLDLPKGAALGTIGLVDEYEIYYGPWKVENVGGGIFEIRPNVVLKPGRYKILDSDPATWSKNRQNAGYAVIRGFSIAVENLK